jgi:hypothetical protein
MLPGILLAFTVGTNVVGQATKAEPEKKSGAVVGLIAAKGVEWVEVKADGEQKPRRYTANWIGGAPKDGGGPDKEIVRVIMDLKVGSRVRLEWRFDERPRVEKIEVMKSAVDADAPQKDTTKKGTVAGILTAKSKDWIEVKADGEEKARRYTLHFGGTKELRDAIQETAVGSRIRIDWLFFERPRVLKLEVIKKAKKDQ